MAEQNSESSFEIMSEDVFDKLLGDAPPEGTPNANEVKGGSKAAPKEEKLEPNIKADKTEDKPEKTQEELEKDLDTAAGEDDTTVDNRTQGVGDSAADILKAQAQGLIERGIWQDFEGIEDFEWTQENYGKLVEAQAEWKAEEKFGERVDKVGDIGKVIIDHIEQGGNPDDIIDLFKASKKLETFDLKTNEGKESLVREYYTKLVGWSDSKTTKYIKSLVDAGDDSLTTEATDAKNLMDKGIQTQIKATQEQTKLDKAQRESQARQWEDTISKEIKGRTDLSNEEKRELQDAVLRYDTKLQDGRMVNKFMLKFMEFQSDPKKYIELVRFVNNPERYQTKVKKEVTTAEAKKVWEFVKGNQSLSRNTGTSHTKNAETSKTDLVIDYKKLI